MKTNNTLPQRIRLYAVSRQRGVYAIEWVIVFPVFFAIFYAVVLYGMTFLVRESMQLAAEDGARIVLRYQTTRADRLNAARTLVQERMSWLPAAIQPTASGIDVRICRLTDSNDCKSELMCSVLMTERCMVHVAFTVAYANSPMVPSLPALSLLVPDALTARASALVDQGGI
jgi:Flp pilus assembly protein TadG